MGNEVRIASEGQLRYVPASGTGKVFATASGATPVLLGYVTNVAYTSGQNVVTIMDRGNTDHHKVANKERIELSYTFLHAVTANFPDSPPSGSGASVPMYHYEIKLSTPEAPSVTAQWMLFMGGATQQVQYTEADDGNTRAYTVPCLAMSAMNPSGYLG